MEFSFKIHKFTNRPKPSDSRNIVIFPIFSEFGSETISVVYCIPKLMRERYQGKYSIVVGWYGREFFYRHLVDEFWELDEKHQELREYCKAFHHESPQLRKLEKDLSKIGKISDSNEMGIISVFPSLQKCFDESCGGEIELDNRNQICKKCHKVWPEPGFFNEVKKSKEELATWLPKPSEQKNKYAQKFIKDNSIGITARNRKCYGRNLSSIFYERLIYLLEDLGYNPIWLGEKATTLPCPFSRIVDFSRMEESRDLELTLALVSQLKFTIQFWTASSRLAALVNTPYLLVESHDQVIGRGQEGVRLELLTKGNKKIIFSHYMTALERQDEFIKLIKSGILEMQNGNWQDIIGLVEDKQYVQMLLWENLKRLGRIN